MTKDIIEISGKSYRVECNWNAIMSFLEARGTAELSAITCLDKLTAKDATILMMCCIAEGERLEGREYDYNPETLMQANPIEMAATITKFMNIFGRQTTPQTEPVESKKKATENR